MEPKREWVYCHSCKNVQRDRRAYRDHLLPVHSEVARRGSNVPVRLDPHELALVWTPAHRARMSGPVRAFRRKDSLGLPRVFDREAEHWLKDNRARTARRHRAAARAREGAPATLTAPDVPAAPETPRGATGDRHVILLGHSRAEPTALPPLRAFSPCERCLHCRCRQPKDYSAAQDNSPSPARRLHTSRRRSSSRRRRSASSPGPPQLWRKAQQDEGPTDAPGTSTLSWDEAQAQFSLWAEGMSQGSDGSPVNFLDPATCDDILHNLRHADGSFPTFDSSDPGSPPPTLESEVAHGERATQTSPVPTHDQSTNVLMVPAPVSTSDQATQVISRPHQASSLTQTPAPALTFDQCTQVLLQPPRSVAYTQTATAPRSTRTSWTQVPHPDLRDTGTDMPVITTTTASTNSGRLLF